MSRPIPSVVVVDDSPEVVGLITTRLRLSGRFDVVGTGADGSAAVALAAELHPDLLLLDVSMPELGGLEALPGILAASSATRVVVYSGFDERGLTERALRAGAVGFVEKSAPVAELIERLAAFADPEGGPPAPDPRAVEPADAVEARDEAVLAQHLERFREAFDDAALGMATMTLTGQLVRANAALAAMLDRGVDELVGVSYSTFVEDDAGQFGSALKELMSGSCDVVQVEHGVPGSASEKRVAATLAPVRDTGGRALYFFLQAQDVSAARAAAERIRRSEERLRLLVEAVQDYAIFMLDQDGRVVSWNVGAERIKGYRADEIIGQHFRIFYPPEKQVEEHPEHELEWALRDGHYEEEGWRIRKDGSRFWANVAITAVYDESGRHIGFGKVTRDTTERREMLDELRGANQRLEEGAERQSRFLAVTAHELRGPIGVLAGSVETLAQHGMTLTSTERRALERGAAASASRLRRLVGDLLTAARLEASTLHLDFEPVDLGEVVTDALNATRRQHPEAEINVHRPGDVEVMADPGRLAQAIENLLGNAIRHGLPPVVVEVVASAGRAEVRVRDEGAGVPEELRSQLFERFAAGPGRGGTGLGLFIVRELARAHGGEASYEPTEGGSGTFVLSIPRLGAS